MPAGYRQAGLTCVGLVNSSVGGQCANAWYGDFASVGLLAVYSAATAAVSPGAGMLGAGLLRSTKLLPPRPGRSSQVRQPLFGILFAVYRESAQVERDVAQNRCGATRLVGSGPPRNSRGRWQRFSAIGQRS